MNANLIQSDNFRKVKAVLSAHKIALWEYDVTTGTIHLDDDYFQASGLQEAGITFETLEQFCEFLHPEDRYTHSPELFRARMLDAENFSQLCVRIISPSGATIWLEENFLSVLKQDEQGSPLRLVFYTENVTERREHEAEIRRLEERNRKIVEALPEFIFILDDNFFIRDVLMSKGTTLLHPIEVLMGIDGRKIYSPEVSKLFLQSIRACLQDGQIQEIEYPLDVKDKGRFYFQARIAPFEGNRVMALIHDIGDRVERAAELLEAKRRAEESDKMKSFFLASMSHEIRTPLNAIIGFSEIIASTDDPLEKEEYIGIIRQNSNLLLQLINDVLDLSRIESGKSEMHIQPTDISNLMEEIEKVHQLKMKQNVTLHLNAPNKKIWTSTDRNRVMQVLFNFLSNAIKNTETGSITLALEEDEQWLKMSVRDTGCGIPTEKLPKIFERFEKLNEFASGTGLGLSICRSIVDRLGGRIEVESTIGEGSTFTLLIPYLSVMPDIHETTPHRREETPAICGKKILVAEDIESAFIQVNMFLNKNHTVLWARNGQEAVSSFMRERPDLVLMDIRMPIMNGVEAIRKIRAISTDIPIIAVTAHSFVIEQQQALAAGCNEVLVKPFSIDQLDQCVNRYIKNPLP